MFNYEGKTKNAYKDEQVAETYHAAFSRQKGWRALRFRLIAYYERKAIQRLLSLLNFRQIIDIPCGTGKLAEVFSKSACDIIAADVSEQMIAIAKQSYERAGISNAVFSVGDVELLSEQFGNKGIDVVVCLRLMHRVPSEVRNKMLSEIARTAPYALISFGIDSLYHSIRRTIRGVLFGGDSSSLCSTSLNEIRQELSRDFQIMETRNVLPFFSEEVVFLLKSRQK